MLQKTPAPGKTEAKITIPAPKIDTVRIPIRGTAPYMQARMSAKARGILLGKMTADESITAKRAPRKARDLDEDFRGAMHVSIEGWVGIPASAFRAACISACRLIGFKMTLAKLAIFVQADGYDALDLTPLVKIEGTPEKHIAHVRNATGVIDMRVRPMWKEWSAVVHIDYDSDLFKASDIINLIRRVGVQVGLGEGRHDSRDSTGLGFGTFEINLEDK